MRKNKLVIIALLIIAIVGVSFYFISTTKTQSLANDILMDIDFDKLDAIAVLDSNSNAKIRDLNADESNQIMQILKKVELKPVRENLVSAPEDHVLAVSGSGGAFRLYISAKGFVFISDDLKDGYKFVDEKQFDDLLNVIIKKHP